ncbi:TIGR03560 family F420-dependent LLM class oxidoreductase [Nocardia sp. SYP-A9097]|uniref:LLM class F420-dependent oxidoreductase n=1 Tax=Nocardia sp. SYP-A9097 TaxID=2663237 RepID=UPI00129ABEAB|nr:LLM class F420-dependent oxidoreductase [Nocardia sp. SYP-A9097]MRH89391.1 TIGR03560 family F420-dependent LLM class oxidoreductase [Nocardia sp. SYP-A9097]
MKFSIFLSTGAAREFAGIPDPSEAYERMVEIAALADRVGYESLLVPDHLVTIPPSRDTLFESWSVLCGLAGETSRIRLGHLVAANGFRQPALAAKMASTVDVISRGRLTFGIGAGWWEPDFTQYGFEFGTAADRLRMLDEAAQIILSMWTQEETTFNGDHYRITGAINEPKGVQRPHIPLLIAGGGEKVTLRLVAKYADACNIIASPEDARHKFAVLAQHCADLGRDPDTITRTLQTPAIIADTDQQALALIPPALDAAIPFDFRTHGLIGSPETIAARIAAFEAAGVEELVIYFADATSLEQVAWFADQFLTESSTATMK